MSTLKAAFYGARSSILHSRTKGIRERIFTTRYYTLTYTKAENYEKSSPSTHPLETDAGFWRRKVSLHAGIKAWLTLS